VAYIGQQAGTVALGLRGPRFASRPCHYSTGWQPWASCLLTLPPQSSQLQETRGTKGSIRTGQI